MDTKISIDLTNREHLIIEASAKIARGQHLQEEGLTELRHLLGEEGSKTIAGRTARLPTKSTFRRDTRSDEEIRQKVLEFIGENKNCSNNAIMRKLHIEDRRLDRLLEGLHREGAITDARKHESRTHRWQQANPIKAKNKKQGNTSFIQIEGYVEKAIELIKNDEWMTESKLSKALDISPGPVKRLVKYLEKNRIAHVVRKNQNPAHKSIPKVFGRSNPYIQPF